MGKAQTFSWTVLGKQDYQMGKSKTVFLPNMIVEGGPQISYRLNVKRKFLKVVGIKVGEYLGDPRPQGHS